MDVFKIDQSLGALGSGPTESSKVTTEVSFDTTSDFNLSFFDSSTPPTPPVQLNGSHPASALLKEEYDEPTRSPHSCHEGVFDPLGSDGLFSPPPVTPPSPSGRSGEELIKAEYEPNRQRSECGLITLNSSRQSHMTLTPLTLFPPPAHSPHLTPTKTSPATNPSTPTTPQTPQTPNGSSLIVKTEPNASAFSSSNDSNGSSSNGSKSFVPCKVCGDKASGYHYGVTSCEGCKGFFRRSIQKQIEYRCLRDGKCLVIRLNRNRCQYCRFKKCLAVGMSRDSVRYGRVPKRSRERGGSSGGMDDNIRSPSGGFADPSTPDSSDSCSTGTGSTPPQQMTATPVRDPESRQLAIYDTILTVSQAFHAHCAYTEEKIRGIVRSPINIISSEPMKKEAQTVTVNADELRRIATWSTLATHITPSIQRVVEFAKRVPGFPELSQDDQLILIKIGFFEVWLGHVTRMINAAEGTLTLSDGATISRQQLDSIFDADFVQGVFSFAEGLSSLAINDSEMALFSAAVLLCPERQGISDTKAITQHQERITDALRLQLLRNHASDPNLINAVLQKVSELRTLGSRHQVQLDWYRHRWSSVQLPPLFAEMFDIPRGEEDLA